MDPAENLRAFIASLPDVSSAFEEIMEQMESALLWKGMYEAAASDWRQELALREDAEAAREEWKRVAEEHAESAQSMRVWIEDLKQERDSFKHLHELDHSLADQWQERAETTGAEIERLLEILELCAETDRRCVEVRENIDLGKIDGSRVGPAYGVATAPLASAIARFRGEQGEKSE